MDAIGPGDWVECVDNVPHIPTPIGGLERLVVGSLYTVKSVYLWARLPMVVLHEVRSDATCGGYQASHFRPIRSDTSSLQRLLTVDTDVREPVGV